MHLIRQGAEAKLFRTTHDGEPALLKQRVEKDYRCTELDERLRRERTAIEANMLRKARQLGIETPQVFSVDRQKKEILMQFIDGPRVKDILNKQNLRLCSEIGKAVAIMHAAGLIHGDLTTSNIMLAEGKRPCREATFPKAFCDAKRLFFIDFGLSFNSGKLEDRAVDLLVFKKTFEATHCALMPLGWEKIMEGYLGAGGNKDVVKQMQKVTERARYS